MIVQIRKDLQEDFSFSTDEGTLIDNDDIYIARYNESDEFQVLIDGKYETIEGIDFDIIF